MADIAALFENIEFNRTYQLLSSHWKVYILCALSEGTLRFGQLRKRFPGISRVTLTSYLQELECEGYVHRTVYPAPPLRTEYSLTELSEDVVPILMQLIEWGQW